MTRCDQTHGTQTQAVPCGCEGCRSGDLPVNPAVALRATYGMLLGEQEFRDLMGNPRGKQMLHNAWLHGSGVIWGFGVVRDGDHDLRIAPGLALDGLGRELFHEATTCLDLTQTVRTAAPESGCDKTTTYCLVAEFDSCLSDPRPTLADPCDVTRTHDDWSRVVERVRFELRPGPCPARPFCGYPRLQILLGLVPHDASDAGREAVEARALVLAATAADRPAELLRQFRRLAALDCVDRAPAREAGDCVSTLFPATDDGCAVVLACVEIDVRYRDGCPELADLRIDPTCRTALLPTCAIQDLLCAAAPVLLGDLAVVDGPGPAGPQVDGPRITLDRGTRLTLPVTAPLAPASLRGNSVRVTSLSVDGPGGWVVEDLYETRFDEAERAIVVTLADRPVNDLIRVIVEGTGPRPVMGTSRIPLAGLVGGPAGTRHDGHDAVWTFPNPAPARDRESDQGVEAAE